MSSLKFLVGLLGALLRARSWAKLWLTKTEKLQSPNIRPRKAQNLETMTMIADNLRRCYDVSCSLFLAWISCQALSESLKSPQSRLSLRTFLFATRSTETNIRLVVLDILIAVLACLRLQTSFLKPPLSLTHAAVECCREGHRGLFRTSSLNPKPPKNTMSM